MVYLNWRPRAAAPRSQPSSTLVLLLRGRTESGNNMILEAEEAGKISPGKTVLVEPTSGVLHLTSSLDMMSW
jgi:hypothetical protein